MDDLTRLRYCPVVDFAVGPFNISKNNIRGNLRVINAKYNGFRNQFQQLCSLDRELEIEQVMYKIRNKPLAFREEEEERLRIEHRGFPFKVNTNPRCFLVIEKENQTGRKHCLGSIINASVFGKIGIVVGSTLSQYRTLMRIRRYYRFAAIVGKTGPRDLQNQYRKTTLIKNIIVLTKEKFVSALEPWPSLTDNE